MYLAEQDTGLLNGLRTGNHPQVPAQIAGALRRRRMNFPSLIQEQQIKAGEYVRIWHDASGRYLFEHVKPAGGWVTINCESLSEAISLWRRAEIEGLTAGPELGHEDI